MLVVLVRHATAGDRAKWHDDDRLRPLDTRGRRQAAALPAALAELPIRRILTSP
jgi:8-oxo-(d)GTP phosphatase